MANFCRAVRVDPVFPSGMRTYGLCSRVIDKT